MNRTAAYSRAQQGIPVAQLGVDVRGAFITRTYTHLLGAILAFALIEIYLFQTGMAESIARVLLGGSWLIVLGGFIILSWIASHFAHSAQTKGGQYGALGLFVVGEAIIFTPLLYVADSMAPGVINSAATVTLLGFLGLTIVAFHTRKDFSFLGGLLRWGFICALVLIVASVLFGFHLGTIFTVAMIVLAGGAILYDTSNVLHHYPEDRHVGAALQLFASVALLFWYILQFFLSSRD
ncbi:MAG: permease [Gemmatimonadetes bacterium]|nr:Bax inhibitor-1 family protein [Gemmatimonadota bacterium]MCY3713801.1 Bax inhibitor-1 family protein [Gemmatimonadota bacterium]MXZ73911.1 permease [Gemmatimonadota bacterium]MYA76512.1 permease [Gemmatimonadota bacterium]MYG15212.1 permease [Gemmatimonadota bacterium]